MHNCLLLASKQASARIDFLRQGRHLVGENGTHDVKNLAEKKTNRDFFATLCWQLHFVLRFLM